MVFFSGHRHQTQTTGDIIWPVADRFYWHYKPGQACAGQRRTNVATDQRFNDRLIWRGPLFILPLIGVHLLSLDGDHHRASYNTNICRRNSDSNSSLNSGQPADC